MDPITAGLLLGGTLGVGKYAGDVSGNASDKSINAATAKYAPWTGQQVKPARKANLFGDLLNGALTGLSASQTAPKLLETLGLTAKLPGAVGAGAAMGAGAGLNAGTETLGDPGLLYAAEEGDDDSISPWDAAANLFSGK